MLLHFFLSFFLSYLTLHSIEGACLIFGGGFLYILLAPHVFFSPSPSPRRGKFVVLLLLFASSWMMVSWVPSGVAPGHKTPLSWARFPWALERPEFGIGMNWCSSGPAI